MIVKFQMIHSNAVLPSYAKDGDAGLDLTCVGYYTDTNAGTINYQTGLAVEIPKGYVGLIFPRSSIRKTRLSLSNSVGVIDSGYRGEICFSFRPILKEGTTEYDNDFPKYQIGDRIGQMIIMPYPTIEPIFANTLSDSERGDGGFGSSGN
jgi:dUTP pyrophosphatase